LHSVGRSDEVRTAERKRLTCDAHVVQFLHSLGLLRRERSQKSGAKLIHLGLNLRLIERVRDLIPQRVSGIQDFPNWRADLRRIQPLATL
jgi:hypothetical protein